MNIEYADWRLETAGWAVKQDDECITLTPADVDGALQISTYTKQTGAVDVDELRALARQSLQPHRVEPHAVQCGTFSGFSGEHREQATFWRRWWLARGRTHLFVTYNVDHQERERHRSVVDWMLSTLGDA